jgi:hypothetical protein
MSRKSEQDVRREELRTQNATPDSILVILYLVFIML